MAIQQNDAAGGAGSLAQGLLGIAVNGLSRVIDGSLSKKYPLTSFNENLVYNADGQIKPRSAPQANVTATEKFAGLTSNPMFLVGGAAVVLTLLIVAVVAIRK